MKKYKCKDCNRHFDTESARDSHNNAIHGEFLSNSQTVKDTSGVLQKISINTLGTIAWIALAIQFASIIFGIYFIQNKLYIPYIPISLAVLVIFTCTVAILSFYIMKIQRPRNTKHFKEAVFTSTWGSLVPTFPFFAILHANSFIVGEVRGYTKMAPGVNARGARNVSAYYRNVNRLKGTLVIALSVYTNVLAQLIIIGILIFRETGWSL